MIKWFGRLNAAEVILRRNEFASFSSRKHPQAVDGIRYRSRHDDNVYSIGLFDRVRDHLTEENLGNLFDENTAARTLSKTMLEIDT